MELELNRKQKLLDYKLTFSSEHGKRVLDDLIAFAGANTACFVAGKADETAFNLGQRNVILRIQALLKMKPEDLPDTDKGGWIR